VEPDQEICNGKYRLVRPIGQGAFGEVWLAEELDSRALVALKRALPSDAEAAKRFQRESILSRQLKHASLLCANTVDRDGPVKYLALPYVPGGSLAERLERGPLAVAEALRVGLAVAEALAYLHAHDIIHRDIHPGNILFDQGDAPLLADLGLAQTVDFSYAQTAEFHPGNSLYHPPEAQAAAGQRVKPALPSFDVYMLGAVLWQALTGRRYFHVKPGTQARELRPDLPASLEKLLLDCLSAVPDARPWDGAALTKLLRAEQAQIELEARQRVEHEAAVEARRVQTAEEARLRLVAEAQQEIKRQAEAQRVQAAEEARLRLVAEAQQEIKRQAESQRVEAAEAERFRVAATAESDARRAAETRNTPAHKESLAQVVVGQLGSNLRLLGVGLLAVIALITVISGGLLLVAAGPWLQTVLPWVPITQTAEPTAPHLTTTPDAVGTQLALIMQTQAALQTAGGTLIIPPSRALTTTPVLVAGSITPSPAETATLEPTILDLVLSGRIAFYSTRTGSPDLFLINADGTGLEQLTSWPTDERVPDWSPDGRTLVFYSNNDGDYDLYTLSLSSRAITKLTFNDCNDYSPQWSPDSKQIVYYSDCDGNREIYLIHPDGANIQQLTFTTDVYNWFPAWSPDGRQIAFASNRAGQYDVYAMNLDGSGLQLIITGCIPAWSPDGLRIAYATRCDGSGDIWVINVDGTHDTQLTTDNFGDTGPTWSPDGKGVIFASERRGNADIYILDLGSNVLSQLTDDPAQDLAPVWTP